MGLKNYFRTRVDAGDELYIICGFYGRGGTGSVGYQTTIASGKVWCRLIAGRWLCYRLALTT